MVREAPFVKAHCLSEHCHTKVTTLAAFCSSVLSQEKDRQRKQIIQLHPPPPETGKVQRDKALLKGASLTSAFFWNSIPK